MFMNVSENTHERLLVMIAVAQNVVSVTLVTAQVCVFVYVYICSSGFVCAGTVRGLNRALAVDPRRLSPLHTLY